MATSYCTDAPMPPRRVPATRADTRRSRTALADRCLDQPVRASRAIRASPQVGNIEPRQILAVRAPLVDLVPGHRHIAQSAPPAPSSRRAWWSPRPGARAHRRSRPAPVRTRQVVHTAPQHLQTASEQQVQVQQEISEDGNEVARVLLLGGSPSQGAGDGATGAPAGVIPLGGPRRSPRTTASTSSSSTNPSHDPDVTQSSPTHWTSSRGPLAIHHVFPYTLIN